MNLCLAVGFSPVRVVVLLFVAQLVFSLAALFPPQVCNKMFTELFQTAALFTLQSDASYVPNLFQPKNGFIEHL